MTTEQLKLLVEGAKTAVRGIEEAKRVAEFHSTPRPNVCTDPTLVADVQSCFDDWDRDEK